MTALFTEKFEGKFHGKLLLHVMEKTVGDLKMERIGRDHEGETKYPCNFPWVNPHLRWGTHKL